MIEETKKSTRQVHVEALQTERENLAARPASDTRDRRLGEVDAQIDEYSDKPSRRKRETAATTPATPTPPAS